MTNAYKLELRFQRQISKKKKKKNGAVWIGYAEVRNFLGLVYTGYYFKKIKH